MLRKAQISSSFDKLRTDIDTYNETLVLPDTDVDNEADMFRIVGLLRRNRNKLIKAKLTVLNLLSQAKQHAEEQKAVDATKLKTFLLSGDAAFKALKTGEERKAVTDGLLGETREEFFIDATRLVTFGYELKEMLDILIDEHDKAFKELELLYGVTKNAAFGTLIQQAKSKLTEATR